MGWSASRPAPNFARLAPVLFWAVVMLDSFGARAEGDPAGEAAPRAGAVTAASADSSAPAPASSTPAPASVKTAAPSSSPAPAFRPADWETLSTLPERAYARPVF